MPLDIIFSSLLVGGLALLWKLVRKEKPIAERIDKLKPFVRRQLVCSPCLIFWLSVVFSVFFSPLRGWIPRFNSDTLWGEAFLFPFLFQSLVLFILANAWLHLVIILIETSHSLTEKAAEKS